MRHSGLGQEVACYFNAGKTQPVVFDRFNNAGATDVKMDRSVLKEKSYFRMLWLTFYSKLDWGSYIISIFETASKKFGTLIRSMKFLSSEANPPYSHAWNTVVTYGLLPLVATWNC